MAGVALAGLMLVVATGATNAPVTAIATGGEAGDSAVVLDNTTRFRDPEAVVDEIRHGIRRWGLGFGAECFRRDNP